MILKGFMLIKNKLIPCIICFFFCFITNIFGEESLKPNTDQELLEPKTPEVSKKVDVNPIAQDTEIIDRIEKILIATNWYYNPRVKVQDGVVFLKGMTKTSEHKQWAEALAKNTQDVVAVVNQIDIAGVSVWDIQTQIISGLNEQWSSLVRGSPLIFMALFILIIAWVIALIVKFGSRKYLNSKNIHPLLSSVITYAAALLCYLFGIYFTLKLLGLTNMALTILGGTGVMGLILGIAFKNITENFLASVLLSVQNPFKNYDLIEVAGVTGLCPRINR
tara:strand:- start:80 stop:910 length:831 start_codon:yes stop_codon:yes gene_type:complete